MRGAAAASVVDEWEELVRVVRRTSIRPPSSRDVAEATGERAPGSGIDRIARGSVADGRGHVLRGQKGAYIPAESNT